MVFQRTQYIPCQEASDLVKPYKLKKRDDFFPWYETHKDELPTDFPPNPDKAYTRRGEWDDIGKWSGFLGNGKSTKKVLKKGQVYGLYEKSQSFIQQYNNVVVSGPTYHKWKIENSQLIPDWFPNDPENAYRRSGHWKGWGHFLGTGKIANQNKKYGPYEDAQQFIQQFKEVTSQSKFNEWKKTNSQLIPDWFPRDPEKVYKRLGQWVTGENGGWGHFLGTGTIAAQNKKFMSLEEFKALCRSLNFKKYDDLFYWLRSKNRPSNVPTNPYKIYKGLCIQDLLGTFGETIWNKEAIIAFINTILPIINNLDAKERYTLLLSHYFIDLDKSVSKSSKLHKLITDVKNGTLDSDDFNEHQQEYEDMIEQELQSYNEDFEDDYNTDDDYQEQDEVEQELPELNNTKDIFSTIDHVATISGSCEETVQFMINNRLHKLWNMYTNTPPEFHAANTNEIVGYDLGEYGNNLRTMFMTEYNDVINMTMPTDFCFPYKPNLMQLYIAYQMTKHNRFGQWSGMGSGKTFSAVLASKITNSKVTVIIGLNNTISNPNEGWSKEINQSFINNNIIIKETTDVTIDPTKHNYILLNYEKFQQGTTEAFIKYIIDNINVDMIVLDEIHFTKQRDDKSESKRRKCITEFINQAFEKNYNCKLLGMSGTPVLNNLEEAKSLLSLITGKKYIDLDTRNTYSNALNIHKHILLNGIRYINETHKLTRNEFKLETIIHDYDEIQQFYNITSRAMVPYLEKLLLPYKLDHIINECKNTGKVIIYSQFVEDIADIIANELTNNGISYGFFNGQDKQGLHDFKYGNTQVLIASSSIGTGIDGLQTICNKLIFATLPWTHGEYEQIIARIDRQGSNFNHIDIIIPQVKLFIDVDKIWSFDEQRIDRIFNKKSLADSAVDGVLPTSGKLLPETEQCKLCLNALNKWIDDINNNGITTIDRPVITSNLDLDNIPEPIKKQYQYGDFSLYNKKFNTSRSDTIHSLLQDDNSMWYDYHELYTEKRKSWPELPVQEIANMIKTKSKNYQQRIIADFGCGESLLQQFLPYNKIYMFDHVAINDHVIMCDMSSTPLINDSVHASVFSLSLMSTNWEDYITEAFRVTMNGGSIFITEPLKKWDNNAQAIVDVLSNTGYSNIMTKYGKDNKFIYITAVAVKPFFD